jgi:hypothetical protein
LEKTGNQPMPFWEKNMKMDSNNKERKPERKNGN